MDLLQEIYKNSLNMVHINLFALNSHWQLWRKHFPFIFDWRQKERALSSVRGWDRSPHLFTKEKVSKRRHREDQEVEGKALREATLGKGTGGQKEIDLFTWGGSRGSCGSWWGSRATVILHLKAQIDRPVTHLDPSQHHAVCTSSPDPGLTDLLGAC